MKYLLIIIAFTQLLRTDAMYIGYLVLFGLTIYSIIKNKEHRNIDEVKKDRKKYILIRIFSILFTSFVVLAEYRIYKEAIILYTAYPIDIFLIRSAMAILLALGMYQAFHSIFVFLAMQDWNIWMIDSERKKKKGVFLVSFSFISAVHLFFLITASYPGILTQDSIWQLEQAVTGVYSNHHPFLHTVTIKLFLDLGMMLFHNLTQAIALYSAFSVMFMAACFAYAIDTLATLGVSRKICTLLTMFYTFMPYHLLYSYTMWKDVMFGGIVLVFIVVSARITLKVGKTVGNDIVLVMSSIGFCLYRSNGFMAFVITTFGFMILYRKKYKKMLGIMLGAIVFSFIMKHSVYPMLHVADVDITEALSIPIQQMSRVVTDHNDLTPREREILSQVVDLEQVPQLYQNYLSDNIKVLIRNKGNQQLILSQKGDFIQTYISLGLRHPVTYIVAWVDQTRGYWNGIYSYWMWVDTLISNDMGVYRLVKVPVVEHYLKLYCWIFEDVPFLRLLSGIGLWGWILLVMLYVSVMKKDYVGIMNTVPIIAIVMSLVVSTPVASEFRYIYSLFCALPIIVLFAIRKGKI